jgi:hypothetical protein
MHPRNLLPTLLTLLTLGGAGISEAAEPRSATTNNIVVILDASGSMQQKMSGTNLTKMAAAKQALTQVVKQVPDNTHVGLLVFSASNVPSGWAYPLGPLDRAKLQAAVQLPNPHGPTPLGEYLKIGADALLQQRAKQLGYGTYRLLVVTDGEATDGNLMDQHLPDILSRGLTIDVIGVDMKGDHALATRVHKYRRANNPKDLSEAVSQAFAEIRPAKDDVGDAEAFAVINGIPDEVAQGMLTALLTSSARNQPIGENPPAGPGGDQASVPSGYVPPAQGNPVPQSGGSSGSSLGVACLGFVGLVAVALLTIFFVVALSLKSHRRAVQSDVNRERRRGYR